MAPNFFHCHTPETQHEDKKVIETQQGDTGELDFLQKKSQKCRTRTPATAGQIPAPNPKSHLLDPFGCPKARATATFLERCLQVLHSH